MSSSKLKKDRKRIAEARGVRTTGWQKSFDREAYDQFDKPAVQAVLLYLESVDIWAHSNDDKYGPDIVVWSGFRPSSYIEVEMRTAWTGGEWPQSWREVHIPERKGHLFSLSLPCEHWIISADSCFALIVPDYVVREYGELKEFSNSKVSHGEKFIHVPSEQCVSKELSPSGLGE